MQKQLVIVLILIIGLVHSEIYTVGPDKQFANIGDAPLNTLVAGDEIHVYWRSEPYKEKFVFSGEGTEEMPIILKGISQDGKKPVIDGNNALSPASQNFWNEVRGLIKIGGSNTPSIEIPKFLIVENFELRNAHKDYQFSDTDSSTQTYSSNAACLYVEVAQDVIFRDNWIHGCGNGIFAGVNQGRTQRLTVQRNVIEGNGNVDSIYEHNSYMASVGITYEGNYYGSLCDGCSGNNLKDRSGGVIIRYNFIENGNRQLDLVDDEDSGGLPDIADYRKTFVYGNVLKESEGEGNRQMIHYGGDSGNTDNYRKGTIYIYHNTIYSSRTDKFTLILLSSNDESADVRNNVIFSPLVSEIEIHASGKGDVNLYNNWLHTGWKNSIESGSGTVTATSNIEGSDPLVNTESFLLENDSPCINAAAELHTDAYPVMYEYSDSNSIKVRCEPEGGNDIGAYSSVRTCDEQTATEGNADNSMDNTMDDTKDGSMDESMDESMDDTKDESMDENMDSEDEEGEVETDSSGSGSGSNADSDQTDNVATSLVIGISILVGLVL
eukprot:TRINITY_DN5573_c0_g1_i1.p2 TRINITY_DN5573_c0_g1~~TRINITY_DN5573_c0_g1_i1.p2  ORF type:complete len:551 (-),score=142.48 TRINITY_DN5573_c0_g1_i1:1704-3356(-)